MPKYRHAEPYDIVREIHYIKQGLKDLVIQLQQNGISLQTGIVGSNQGPGGGSGGGGGGGLGATGGGTGLGGNIVFEPEAVVVTSVSEAIVADPNLTHNQKKALQELYNAYLRSNDAGT